MTPGELYAMVVQMQDLAKTELIDRAGDHSPPHITFELASRIRVYQWMRGQLQALEGFEHE
jgi:hypothetical protein